jgi:hypothetical protein
VPTETLGVYLEPQVVQLAGSPVWLCIRSEMRWHDL